MFEFLKNNLTFVAIACICAFGVFGKLLARHRYQSLLRQSESISNAKDKFLKQIRTKYEGVFRMNRGVRNANAFVRKQLYRYRCGLFRLETLDNFSAWGAIFCFAIGVANSLIELRTAQEVQEVLVPLLAGILAAAGLILVDRAADNRCRRQELISHLQDYLENNVQSRMEANVAASANGRIEAAVARNVTDISAARLEKMEKTEKKESVSKPAESGTTDKIQTLRREKTKRESFSPLRSHGKEGASLKKSLEQAAASKDVGEKKNLSQEEEALMEEIIREYLS